MTRTITRRMSHPRQKTPKADSLKWDNLNSKGKRRDHHGQLDQILGRPALALLSEQYEWMPAHMR